MLTQNPITAVTEADPYPFYADLTAHRPFYRDDALGLWVASSAGAVTAVLTSDLCRVRPLAEPVPQALLGSPAGDIFRSLIRMNDGERHDSLKRAASAAFESIDMARVADYSSRWARFLSAEIRADAARLAQHFAFRLPVYVVASLLGVPEDKLPQTARWVGDFARCFSPVSSPDQIERGKSAAAHLLDLFRSIFATRGGLPGALSQQAGCPVGENADTIVANAIGFLSQNTYEATAGLIGNTLLALARQNELREQVAASPDLLRDFIKEILRYDPPIQNTRRFLAADGVVAGERLRPGDAILVILAATNRDPAVNPHPERFDIFRQDRRIFTFGVGAHACLGEALAVTIAKAGVEQLLMSGIDLERLPQRPTYRPSANARVPLFANEEDV
ncbi:MAG TPA: cytochrome P450 [Blastocatellia bacterium]|nr:cytochrome P450 [Blastocatellia bacterium]